MKVQDLMTADVACIEPDTPFKEIAETLARKGVSGLPVIDDNGFLVGIVSEGDLLAKEAYGARRRRRRLLGLVLDVLSGRDTSLLHKAEGLTAKDIMTERVTTIGPEEDIRRAAKRLVESGLKRLPVVTDGRLVGIISRADLLEVFDRSDESIAGSLRQLVRRCLFVPPEADVALEVEDGVVTLNGHVHYRSDVDVLGAIIAASDGVVDVVNNVTFTEEDPKTVR